jgi:alpha-galactosidase
MPRIAFIGAGINHLAFFLRIERDGEDLYSALRDVEPPADDRVRYEVMHRLGHFATESSEHFAEYVPWFIKSHRPDLVERVNVPLDEYIRRSEAQIAEWDELAARLERGGDLPQHQRSHEYGADIVRACETGEPFRFNGNVPNKHAGGLLIDNLPADCCVEVPCIASARGIEPQPAGPLPRQLAALIQTNVNVQRGSPSRPRSPIAARPRATPRCSTRTPPPSCRSTRSPPSSTSCSTRTARPRPPQREPRPTEREL